jgi:hypothetical protein
MGNFDRRGGVLVHELNDSRLTAKRCGKVVVFPIRAKGKRSRPADDTSRSAPAPGETIDKLKELRFELRCVEEAIVSLERLALNRLSSRPEQPLNMRRVRAEQSSR